MRQAASSDLLPTHTEVRDQDLVVGGCSVRDLADAHGTPAYVIDEQALRERARAFCSEFGSRHADTMVCFASKANPSVAVLRVLADEGVGVDVVGAGELLIASTAGMPSDRTIMHGNAKSDDDIRAAVRARIRFIVVDGLDEVDRISRIRHEVLGVAGPPVPVLLRVRPGVEAATHEALATGGVRSKFGVAMLDAPAVVDRMHREPGIDLQGLHMHIGSGISALHQWDEAIARLAQLPRFGVYDVGGGLGIPYVAGDPMPTIAEFAQVQVDAVHRHLGRDVTILTEPGRSMVGPAGLTTYRVVTVKRGRDITHVAVDGGMGDNLEVALYGQPFAPIVVGAAGRPLERVSLVGRHCEEGDVLVPDVTLPRCEVGDLVVIPVTGAYCHTMSNNYNAALRPPMLFCRDGVARVGVRRETYADLLARDVTSN